MKLRLPWDWIVIALVVTAVTLIGALSRAARNPSEVDGVVVASRDIEPYERITDADLRLDKAKRPTDALDDVQLEPGTVSDKALKAGSPVKTSDFVAADPGVYTWVAVAVPRPSGTVPKRGRTVVLLGATEKSRMKAGAIVSESTVILSSDAKTVRLLIPKADALRLARYLAPDAALLFVEP